MHGTEDIFDFYGKTFLASNQLEKGRTINGMMCFTKAFGSLFLTFIGSGLGAPPITTMNYISRQILEQANFVKNRS